mgnify:CR=1 FL=1
MEQGTPEWLAARAGKVTASRVSDVMMAKTTAGYQNYRSQLVCELLTGQPTETHTSAAMQHGTDTEPQARAMYTLTTGNMVQEVGFIPHPLISGAGASPDGLIGEYGLVEIKCPQPTEHIRTLTGGAIKKGYLLQMQWQMACTGREWCDFVSYSNDFPDELRMHVQRVNFDHDLVADLEKAVTAFCAEVQNLLETLKGKAAA